MPPGLLRPIPKCAWPEGGGSRPSGAGSVPAGPRCGSPTTIPRGRRGSTSIRSASSERHHDPEPGQLAVDSGQHQLVALDAGPDPALLDQQRSHACPCPDLRAGRTAATTAPSSSSLTAPRRRRGPARRPMRPRHTDARSCDPPRPLIRRAQPLPAQPAARLPESRSPPPPETPLDSSRSLDLNGSVAVAPRHHGVRHAGGPTTGNPGGPMKVARNGSDRSHDGGRRHDRGNSPTSVRQSPR
jgi:hypothetical protein